jgi:MFS-type transporter involved in bile tolerance (Atg22 family)
MNMALVVILSMSMHACSIGSKVIVSLFGLKLGASQLMVGVLASFYAVVPMLIGVYTGRLADARGARLPLMIGAIGTIIAMLSGFLLRDIASVRGECPHGRWIRVLQRIHPDACRRPRRAGAPCP